MRTIKLQEPSAGVWTIGPFLDEKIEFWYGELTTKHLESDNSYLNIYLVKNGIGKIEIETSEGIEELIIRPNYFVQTPRETHISSDEELELVVMRTKKPRFDDYDFIHTAIVGKKWLTGEWIGCPVQIGEWQGSELTPEDNQPHYHMVGQELYLPKKGRAILKHGKNLREMSSAELCPGQLYLVESEEVHYLDRIIEAPVELTFFNYPSLKNDKVRV